jgi:uncharacterized membrane protein
MALKQTSSKLLIFLTTLVLSLNIFLSSTMANGSIPYILGQVFFFPLLITGIFILFPKNRNWNSITKIILFSSVIMLLSLIGNVLTTVQETLTVQKSYGNGKNYLDKTGHSYFNP